MNAIPPLYRYTLVTLFIATCMVSNSQVLAESANDFQRHFQHYAVNKNWDVTTPRGKPVTVDFTTTEATQSSVDITPDGKWVVFDLLGHIYRVPSVGGEAQVLTQNSGLAINFHPSISRDGSKIAFISDRKGQNNLWVMNLDGSNPEPVFLDPVTRLTRPEWAHDDSAIYAVRYFPTYSMHRRSGRIWRFPFRRPGEVPGEVIGEPSGQQAEWPSLSADGKSLYYMYSTFPSQFTGRQRYQHVRRYDLTTGSIRPMTLAEGLDLSKNEAFTELAPEVSPDGQWLAFARRIPNSILEYRGHRLRHRTALWLLNLKTGEERIAMDPITRDNQDVHGMKKQLVLPGYSWASDSKSLVINEGGKIRRLWIKTGKVETIDFRARVHRIASEQTRAKNKLQIGQVAARVIRWAQITPDGGTAFFQAAGTVWRKALPDGQPVPVAGRADTQLMPALSPDGKTLAWVSWDSHKLGQLWTMPVKGGKARKVSDRAGAYLFPTWSGAGELYVIRAASTDSAALANGRPTDFAFFKVKSPGTLQHVAAVSPAPVEFGPADRLYWAEQHGVGHDETQRRLELGIKIPPEYAELNSIAPNEPGNLRQHMRFPAAEWAAPSADGKWVAFVDNGELYLTTFQHNQTRFDNGNPMTWQGRQQPYHVVRENPDEQVRQVTEGGVVDPRWLDEQRLVFAQGDELRIYNVADHTTQRYPVDLQIGEPASEKVLALTNARIVTLKQRKVIERGTLIIKGDRIQCVGDCATETADQIMNLNGKTLIPGFVDVHAHGFGGGSPLISDMLPSAALYLSHGVTTAMDPYADRLYALGIAELIHAGRLPGPRTYTTGVSTAPRSPRTGPANYREAEAEVKRNASLGAISTKIYLSPRRDQRQMFVEASRKFGMSVTNEAADLLSDVASLLDGSTGLEHAMNLVPSYDDVAQFFAQIKGVYSPTLVVSTGEPWAEEYFRSRMDVWTLPKQRRFMPWNYLATSIDHSVAPKEDYAFPIYAETVKDILRAGGFAAIGGHAQNIGLDSHWEVWSYATALEPIEALEMASLGGARMLGMDNQLGSLEPGKVADLMILDANPLDNIRNTLALNGVIKGGVLYDDETLDEIWPIPKKRPLPAWVEPDVFRDTVKPVGVWSNP